MGGCSPTTLTPGVRQTDTVERGINRKTAYLLVAETAENKLREKLALFDWLSKRKDRRLERNGAGFLYRSIVGDFALPDDYQAAVKAQRLAERKVVPLKKRRVEEEASAPDSDRLAIDQYWNGLAGEEQDRIERELVAGAPRFLKEQYLEGQQARGVLFRACRQAIIDRYVRDILAARRDSAEQMVSSRVGN